MNCVATIGDTVMQGVSSVEGTLFSFWRKKAPLQIYMGGKRYAMQTVRHAVRGQVLPAVRRARGGKDERLPRLRQSAQRGGPLLQRVRLRLREGVRRGFGAHCGFNGGARSRAAARGGRAEAVPEKAGAHGSRRRRGHRRFVGDPDPDHLLFYQQVPHRGGGKDQFGRQS